MAIDKQLVVCFFKTQTLFDYGLRFAAFISHTACLLDDALQHDSNYRETKFNVNTFLCKATKNF